MLPFYPTFIWDGRREERVKVEVVLMERGRKLKSKKEKKSGKFE